MARLKQPAISHESSRILTFWESVFAEMHESFSGHNTTTAYTVFELDIESAITAEFFSAAMNKVYLRHPVLRSVITGSSGTYIMEQKANYEHIPIKVIQEGDLESIFIAELNTPLELEKYLWRASLLVLDGKNEYALVISACHAVIDGGSVAMMLRDAMFSLVQTARSKPVGDEVLKSYQSMGVTPAPVKEDDLLKVPQWPMEQAYTDSSNCKTSVCIREVPIEALHAIKPALKAKGITINDYIAGLYLSTIQMMKSVSVEAVALFTPVNLRPFTEPAMSFDDVMNSMVTIDTAHNIVVSDSVEAYALDYQKQSRDAIADIQDGNFSRLSIKSIEQYLADNMKPRNKFTMGFGLSNIGKFDFGLQPLGVNVSKFIFCGSRRAADCPVLLCVLSDKQSIRLIFSYSSPMVSDRWMKEFADKMSSKLATGIM